MNQQILIDRTIIHLLAAMMDLSTQSHFLCGTSKLMNIHYINTTKHYNVLKCLFLILK